MTRAVCSRWHEAACGGAHPSSRPSRGFALISAIFLLVVLAMLGTTMLALSNTQQVAHARDILGSRAYFAARAGIEWGVYQLLQNSGRCVPHTDLAPAALTGSAQGLAVTVTCTQTSDDPDGSTVYIYQVSSTASQGTLGSLDYSERQLNATVTLPRWTMIADEDAAFTVSGTRPVRFGSGKDWITKTVTGADNCTIASFGGDPIEGTLKHCEVESAFTPVTWTKVADEWDYFTTTGTQTYRFGTGNSWITKTFNGVVHCVPGSFPSDPAVGLSKQCDRADY